MSPVSLVLDKITAIGRGAPAVVLWALGMGPQAQTGQCVHRGLVPSVHLPLCFVNAPDVLFPALRSL